VIEEADRGVPTFWNNLYRLATFWMPRPMVQKCLLNNVSGYVKVRSMQSPRVSSARPFVPFN